MGVLFPLEDCAELSWTYGLGVRAHHPVHELLDLLTLQLLLANFVGDVPEIAFSDATLVVDQETEQHGTLVWKGNHFLMNGSQVVLKVGLGYLGLLAELVDELVDDGVELVELELLHGGT